MDNCQKVIILDPQYTTGQSSNFDDLTISIAIVFVPSLTVIHLHPEGYFTTTNFSYNFFLCNLANIKCILMAEDKKNCCKLYKKYVTIKI